MNLAFKKILAILLHATFALVASFSYVTLAHAATTTDASTTSSGSVAGFVPLTSLPGIQNAANATTLPVFLNEVYKICIGVAAVLAVLYIMYAGVEFMTSRGSVSSNENAKKHIQNAILGLILVLSPTIVFGIINPDILHLDLNVSALKPDALQNIDTSSSSTMSDLQAQQCNSIVQKKTIPEPADHDRGGACSAIGAGWANYDSACCSITDADHACCGYDPANNQNHPAPPPPEAAAGNYTYDFYLRQQDYSDQDNGYCLMEHTYHYTSQSSCTTALNQAKSSADDLYAVSNNCSGGSTLGQISPAATYNQIKNLHICQE